MKARDVMVSPVITVKPHASVQEVAKTLVDRRISAVPVVDDAGKLVGIVSEGDLMHRSETGTERRYRWWIRLMGAWVMRDEARPRDAAEGRSSGICLSAKQWISAAQSFASPLGISQAAAQLPQGMNANVVSYIT